MNHTIKRSTKRSGRIKVYATVPSRTREGVEHKVVYIRSKNFRGCLCDCESFMFDKAAKNRNCEHIRNLRQTYGRYFSKVS
jgi:hypothetical protein